MNNPFVDAILNRKEYIENSANAEEIRRENFRKEYSTKVTLKINEICKKIAESTDNEIPIIDIDGVELIRRAKARSYTSIWEYYHPFTCCLIERLENFGVRVYPHSNVCRSPASLVVRVEQVEKDLKCS